MRAIGNAAAMIEIFAKSVNRRQFGLHRRVIEFLGMRGDQRIGADQKPLDLAFMALMTRAISSFVCG